VLCHSHPGHGESEGAVPSPSNFFFENDYNRSSHNYLTLCGAIQGLRVLESLSIVNKSQIMVTGLSYGGLNTMWLAGVCGERIAGALPHIAIGDMEKVMEDPTKLMFWAWNKNVNNIPDSFWNDQNLRTDPLYYLMSDKLPPILWQFGTTDEFWHHHSINGTYDSVQNSEAYLQIFPNGHHGLYDYQDNTKFFIDYIVYNGPTPPKIESVFHYREDTVKGDDLIIECSIDSSVQIKSVQVVYKYLDIIGTCWEVIDLERFNGDGDEWSGIVESGIITSRVDYYIIVNLESDGNLWFSSKIYTAGSLNSSFTIYFYVILIVAVIIPIALIFWRRYRKNVKDIKKETQSKARINLIIEFSLIFLTHGIFFFSLILPLISFGNSGTYWSTVYLFNNFYTWKQTFGSLAPFLTTIFITLFVLSLYLSLMKPMLSGLAKIIYFVYVSIIFSLFSGLFGGSGVLSDFPTMDLSIGYYLILIIAISLFLIGIWKRIYQTKLNIRTPKSKFYNIDRWFRIKD
jgi:hypothetical protein